MVKHGPAVTDSRESHSERTYTGRGGGTDDGHHGDGDHPVFYFVFYLFILDLTHYLSINRFLKASSHMLILLVVWSDMAVTISICVEMPAALLNGRLMHIPGLRTLLD